MQGDFSRDTFDRRQRFSRVLMQQGRVLLDADWNEQTSILLHYIRALAADVIGPHGGPGDGFKIRCTEDNGDALACDFTIGRGHYYVDGILCENLPAVSCAPGEAAPPEPPPLRYGAQPDYPLVGEGHPLDHNTDYLVYLDVWERHVTHLEAEHIREVALGGPDTATRARVVWQVKVAAKEKDTPDDLTCHELLDYLLEPPRSCLRARARVKEPSDDPCIIPPEARYRGAENQLYRVEIHDAGEARGAKQGATFKWSRDNGSIVFAIRELEGSTVTLDTLGPDVRRGLTEEDWVEIVDDHSVLRGVPGPLARVDAVDRVAFKVTLAVPEGEDPLPGFGKNSATHPLARRWDQGSDAIALQEGKWIDLEDGVQIWFQPDGSYRSGDYWLIPARTAIGDVLWPTETSADGTTSPRSEPPHGIEHHYAPLAHISLDDEGAVSCEDDCRCIFEPLCPAPSRLDAVYFDRDSGAPREAMREVVIANAEKISTRLAVESDVRVRVVGYAPSGQNKSLALAMATRRAEAVVKEYVDRGIARDRIDVSAELDDSTRPPDARHRVGTRFVKTSEHTMAGEESGVTGLLRIAGVGPARAEKFLGAGRNTPADVAAMSVEEIKSLLDVTDTVAASIRDSARAVA